MIPYKSPPTVEFSNSTTREKKVRLFIRREDLNHPVVSGNKWWKLKYNLEEVKDRGLKNILTFGGAYSNHIFASSAAAKEYGFQSIGIIRGEKILPLNNTLAFAESNGMKLHFISRTLYQQKIEKNFVDDLQKTFGEFYLIPEGGTNLLAIRGCEELGRKILSEHSFDYLCLPVGTGGTMAGIVSAFEGKKKVIGFSVLKGGSFLSHEIENLLMQTTIQQPSSWRIEVGYDFGGYGKSTTELLDFINMMNSVHNLPLDKVYTAKMVYGILDLIRKDQFEKGATILVLHTGGMQGNYES